MHTIESVREWGLRLTKEKNSLGESLIAIADSWQAALAATSAPEIDTDFLRDLLERLNGQYRAALAVGYCPSSGPYRAALSKAAKASAALSACFDALATNAPAERDEQPEYTEAEVDFLVEKLEGIATSAPSEPAPLRKFVEHCLTLEGGMVSGNLLKYEAEKVLAEAAALQSTPAVLQPEAPAEPHKMTDVQQISMALQPLGLSLLKTATGYKVEKLGPIVAHIEPDLSSVKRGPNGGDRMLGEELRADLTPPAAEVEERRELSKDAFDTSAELIGRGYTRPPTGEPTTDSEDWNSGYDAGFADGQAAEIAKSKGEIS